MANLLTITRREIGAFFGSPIFWVLATAFMVFSGFVFAIIVTRPGAQADMLPLLGLYGTVMLFVAPLMSMRLLAEEQRSGTLELLMTSPVDDWQVVWGKWLGALFMLGVIVALTLFHVAVMLRLATEGIDVGPLAASYLGLILLGAALLAIGVLTSSLTPESGRRRLPGRDGRLDPVVPSLGRADLRRGHGAGRDARLPRPLRSLLQLRPGPDRLAGRALHALAHRGFPLPGHPHPRVAEVAMMRQRLGAIAPYLSVFGLMLLAGSLFVRELPEMPAWSSPALAAAGVVMLALWPILQPEVFRDLLGARQARFGGNALLLTVGVLGVIGILNYLGTLRYARWDVTENKRLSISNQTKQILDDIAGRRPGDQPDRGRGAPNGAEATDLRPLVEQYTRQAPNINFQVVDPQFDIGELLAIQQRTGEKPAGARPAGRAGRCAARPRRAERSVS